MKGGSKIQAGVGDVSGDSRRTMIENYMEIVNNIHKYDQLDKEKSFDVLSFTAGFYGPQAKLENHQVPEKRYFSYTNFWIAKCDYLKTLKSPNLNHLMHDLKFLLKPGRTSKGIGHVSSHVWRYSCETWIGQKKDAVFYDISSKTYKCVAKEK
tara:strand:- start:75 stop:533 length:459 start_codon:yes stop_codon:yes gene_type:complete